jgi:hypothetical protein
MFTKYLILSPFQNFKSIKERYPGLQLEHIHNAERALGIHPSPEIEVVSFFGGDKNAFRILIQKGFKIVDGSEWEPVAWKPIAPDINVIIGELRGLLLKWEAAEKQYRKRGMLAQANQLTECRVDLYKAFRSGFKE